MIERLFGVLLVLAANHLNTFAQDTWKLEKSQQGIMVYTRSIEETDIREFKAMITIAAPMEELIQALNDVPAHTDWMAGVSHASELNDEGTLLHYNLKVPFPMNDRYVVMNTLAKDSANTHMIAMTPSKHIPDDVDGRVRIPYVKGYWQFTQIDAWTTDVHYQFVSDPGGSVPDWIVNMFIVQNPFKTLTNLRKRLEK